HGRAWLHWRPAPLGRARPRARASALRPWLSRPSPASRRESIAMIGIVLVGHGALAPEALRSIESVLGHPVPGMVAVGATSDRTLASLRTKIAAAVASVEQ